jgi:hypothetical protein
VVTRGADLPAAISKLATLEQILAWAFAQRPAAELLEVIVQDEYSHDVVVQQAAGFLVFDTT